MIAKGVDFGLLAKGAKRAMVREDFRTEGDFEADLDFVGAEVKVFRGLGGRVLPG